MVDYIRKENQPIQLTLEQTVELARIMKRPTGVRRFIHYVDVNTATGPLNFGKIIKPYQFDMIDLLEKTDRSIILASRQMSKCVTGDSRITVRNDITGEISNITVGEFHELIKQETTKK